MASYFNLTDNGALLSETTRCREDIEYLVDWAEYELISFYTTTPYDSLGTPLQGMSRIVTGLENLSTSDIDPVVYLRYYKADADELTSAPELTFKATMQRAIAMFVEARAATIDRDPTVQTEWRGRRRVTYYQSANRWESSVPRSVKLALKAYDARPAAIAI